MLRALRAAFACALITLAVTGTARAAGGNYVFDGGTAQQQRVVRSALEVSTFPWGVVPRQVVIHVASGISSQATPGQIWLDSALLDTGAFSWGLVQHEYAHQVDFLLLDDAVRAALLQVLGGRAWGWDVPGLDHADYGSERFASTLAWSYWQSSDNSLRPVSPGDEAGAATPRAFKALLGRIFAAPAGFGYQVAQLTPSIAGKAPSVRPSATGGTATRTNRSLAAARGRS